METIREFKGEYRYLSNFWPCRVELDGLQYDSVEHAYQAAKTTDPAERRLIRNAVTPAAAKKLGRHVIKLREDWTDEVKLDVMHGLLLQKFAKEPLRTLLLNTGEADLVEGNNWGDKFWGFSGGEGFNWLGILLMHVRARLRKGIREQKDSNPST